LLAHRAHDPTIPCLRQSLVFCAIFTTCLVAGCSDDPPRSAAPAGAPPFAGQTIHISAPTPLRAAERWPLILTEFENEWGAHADIRQRSLDAGLGEYVLRGGGAEFANQTSHLWFFPLNRAELMEGLAPIPRDERDDSDEGELPWSDVFAGLRKNVCTWNGEAVVMPISAPVLVCYYRRDLLEEAGLAPPVSWSEYQQLLDTLDEWAPGLSAVEPWGPEYRATMYLARALGAARHPGQYSLYFDIETGEPLIDTPGFVRGLEQSVAAVKRMPRAVLAYSPADCRRELLAGRAALAIAFETPGAADKFPIGPNPEENDSDAGHAAEADARIRAAGHVERAESIAIGITPLPGATEVYNDATGAWEQPHGETVNRVALTGFAGLCAGVSADSHPEARRAAWKLLARLTVSEFATAFPPEMSTLCRTSQAGSPSRWVGEALTGDEALAYVTAVSESLRNPLLVAEIPVRGRDDFRRALTKALEGPLAGTQSPAEALSGAAGRWGEIADELGREAVRDSYRARLGLPPVRP
jgi:multiple sugar transport system substrate-binding protein